MKPVQIPYPFADRVASYTEEFVCSKKKKCCKKYKKGKACGKCPKR